MINRENPRKIPVLGKIHEPIISVRAGCQEKQIKWGFSYVIVVVVIASKLFLNSCYTSNVGKFLYNLYVICTVCSESFEGLSAKSNSRNCFCFQEETHECLVIYQEDISILRLCTWSILIYFNPFLFIKGLSCPGTVQTLLTQNCLKLTIRTVLYSNLDNLSNSFVFLVVTLVLNKYICKVLVWKSLPLLPFRALLPFENSSAEWSGLVWQASCR